MSTIKIGTRGRYSSSLAMGTVAPFACVAVSIVLVLLVPVLLCIGAVSPILGACGLLYREKASEPA